MKVFVTKDHDTSMVSSKMMRLIPLGANQTIVAFGDDEYFFSYQTCVAGFTSGEGYWRTSEKFSQTTSRHINKYLGARKDDATVVDQSDIEVAMTALAR